MAKIDSELFSKLTEGLADPQRLLDGAGLAGKGLVMPLATLRTRIARRELRRIETRSGEKSPEANRQADLIAALTLRESEISADLARRLAPRAPVGKDEASLSGRITCDGKPLFDVTVIVLDGEAKALHQTCTGRDGRFTLALPADTNLRIELREQDKRVFRDKQEFAYPPGYPANRDIEIGQADPVCDPSDPAMGETLQMPALIGLTVEQAKKSVTALGFKLGKIKEKSSSHPGIVIAQEPAAGAKVSKGADVTLTIGTKKGWTVGEVGDLSGKSLADGLKAMEAAQVAPASVTIVEGSDRTPMIRSATPNSGGDAMHLEVAVSKRSDAVAGVLAAMLAFGAEGQSIGLATTAEASHWLSKAKISSIDDILAAATESDAQLRRRLSLTARADVGEPRKALLAIVSRVRRS